MSVNLAELLKRNMSLLLGLWRLLQRRCCCERLPGNGKASDGGIFSAGLTFGGKGIDNFYASL